MSQVLEGVKVLELASVLAGPLAGTALAARGATVTKVERPPNGDVTRSWKSATEQVEGDTSAYYASANAGKRVVWCDLGSEEGQEWLEAALAEHDVLLHNFKAADLVKFGLEPADLARRHPHLINVRLLGFPGAPERLAYDVVVQAETGFMSMNGEPGSKPLRMPVALMDVLASHQIRTAVLEGLLGRSQGRTGAYAEVSLEASGISALVNQSTNFLMNGEVPHAQGSIHPNIAPYGDLLKCADGWMVLAVGNDRQFQRLCAVLGHANWSDRPEFLSNVDRLRHREALMALLNEAASSQTRAHWDAAFQKNGIPAGVVRRMDEVFAPGSAGAGMLLEDETGRRPSPVAYRLEWL
jgi:crotonobetainyl-CoA:carnitine CoA-transferase CaiB-like acyl-CoA transferase